jgi:pimeloyl-ACP methyl ester carboxylesterase
MAGWFNIVRLAGMPVRSVDPRRTDYVPVFLIPGFLSGDWSMIPLARRLRRAGHPTLTSGILVNAGCTEALIDGLERRLEQAVETAGRPLAVVGQSRGGSLGRMLVAKRPDLAGGLITLSSPLLHQLATTRMVVRQVDTIARLNVRGWPWLLSADCLAGGCAERTNAMLAAEWPAWIQPRNTSRSAARTTAWVPTAQCSVSSSAASPPCSSRVQVDHRISRTALPRILPAARSASAVAPSASG